MRREELADAADQYTRRITGFDGSHPKTRKAIKPIIESSRGRFLGVGAEQYQISETEQSFERSTIGTMLVGLSEELVDQINYAAMIEILISRRFASGVTHDQHDALSAIRADLKDMTHSAVCAAVLLNRHVEHLIKIGEYERRGESDYVSQLSAECAEANAPMRGASGRSSAEIEAAYDARPTPDTPDGLDAILAARMDDDGAGD